MGDLERGVRGMLNALQREKVIRLRQTMHTEMRLASSTDMEVANHCIVLALCVASFDV